MLCECTAGDTSPHSVALTSFTFHLLIHMPGASMKQLGELVAQRSLPAAHVITLEMPRDSELEVILTYNC